MTSDSVGGYRLVRSLGEGARAEVFLGHPIAVADEAGQVAVKIYRQHVPFGEIERELDALSAAAGPHAVSVLDCSTGPHGAPVVIFQRLGRTSLASLLAARGSLSAGEAITILVPLAGTLARLRAAGVAHRRVNAGSVFFTPDGAPVLACFGAATVTGATNAVERDADVSLSADLVGLRDLARSVLSAATGGDEALVGDITEWLESAIPDEAFPDDLCTRLFEVGRAEPVTLSAPQTELSGVRGELVPARPRGNTGGPRRASVIANAVASVDRVPELMGRIREVIAPVRARFWVIGAGALALLVASLVLVPQGSSDATSEVVARTSPPPSASPSPATDGAPEKAAADISGDDPAAALDALLKSRDRCIRSASILCLDEVDQNGSQALRDDQDRIRAVQEGDDVGEQDLPTESVPAGPWRFEVKEQLGGAALVSVFGAAADSEPASILLIRSEAGWRIRDYLR